MPANIGAELQALPLEYLLGSPMQAAIAAQALAAKPTSDFILPDGFAAHPLALREGQTGREAGAQSLRVSVFRTRLQRETAGLPNGGRR